MKLKNILRASVLLVLLLWLAPTLAISQNSAHKAAAAKLLIIAPDTFIDELDPLKRFKDASGRPTILLSLSQVYNDFDGVDQAEEVKRCIAHYETYENVAFVMLVGDVDQFPTRYQWWGLPGQEGWGASDLYYADLYDHSTGAFNDWDINDNGLYAEVEFNPDGAINNDHIDFLPDVAVGRIPASTEAEVTAYVNKVIAYETKTTPSDAWFKQAGLYTGTWSSEDNTLKDDVAGYLSNRGFTQIIKRYTDWNTDPPQPPTAGSIIGDLNSGLGFANYAGHGISDAWACVGLSSASLAGLNNADMLPIAFANACDTGMFAWLPRAHPYIDTNGQTHCGVDNGESLSLGAYPHPTLPRPAPIQAGIVSCSGPLCTNCEIDRPCIAETFLFGNPTGSTGAIAYVGARSGARPGQSMDLDRHFFRAYESGINVLGNMWKYMLARYYEQHNLGDSHNWFYDTSKWEAGHTLVEPQKYILFGDPSLVAGGVFTATQSGSVWDSAGGPWLGYHRYRITGDVSIPTGTALTVHAYASVLFESGRKITAMGSDDGDGLAVNGTTDMPAYLISTAAEPQSEHAVRGIKVAGQIRVRSGGNIKLW